MNVLEMSLWSIEELRIELRKKIFPALEETTFDRGRFVLFLRNGSEVIYSAEGIDERILLFDAYGWSTLREGPSTGTWGVRTKELSSRDAYAAAVTFEDPPDVDPDELVKKYGLV